MLQSLLTPEAKERRRPQHTPPSLTASTSSGCSTCSPLCSLPPPSLPRMVRLCLSSSSLSVARIALVKPDKAGEVTDRLLAMAQRGSVTERISEAALKRMIEQVNEGSHTAHHTRITVRHSHTHTALHCTPHPLDALQGVGCELMLSSLCAAVWAGHGGMLDGRLVSSTSVRSSMRRRAMRSTTCEQQPQLLHHPLPHAGAGAGAGAGVGAGAAVDTQPVSEVHALPHCSPTSGSRWLSLSAPLVRSIIPSRAASATALVPQLSMRRPRTAAATALHCTARPHPRR